MSGELVLDMPSDISPRSTFELGSHSDSLSLSHRSRIINLTVDIPSSHHPQHPESHIPKPRWWTLEFMVYYVVFLIAVPVMIWIPVRLSSRMWFVYLLNVDCCLPQAQLHIPIIIIIVVDYLLVGCLVEDW
jgi:hypothetical protein